MITQYLQHTGQLSRNRLFPEFKPCRSNTLGPFTQSVVSFSCLSRSHHHQARQIDEMTEWLIEQLTWATSGRPGGDNQWRVGPDRPETSMCGPESLSSSPWPGVNVTNPPTCRIPAARHGNNINGNNLFIWPKLTMSSPLVTLGMLIWNYYFVMIFLGYFRVFFSCFLLN